MTKKRMLGMVNSKCLAKFIEVTELPKSVFPKSLKFIKSQENDDQHSKTPVLLKQTHSNKEAFQKEEIENNQQQLKTYISNMLFLENKQFVDSSFMIYVDPVIEDKVNAEMRDYTVKNLQIMNKVFFELPINILVKSVTLIDHFISRVKVKPKYMSCVATACFYIAAKTAEPIRKANCPTLETLSQLSKCGGTVQDLERMVEIIMMKLDNNYDFVTSYNFLEFFHRLRVSERLSTWPKLEAFLEIAQTSLKVCYQKPSVVALACLSVNSRDNDLTFVKRMSIACKIELKLVLVTAELITQLFREYSSRQPSSRNSLVWVISKRTLANMYGASPTSLATISEEVYSCSRNNNSCVSADCDLDSSMDSLFEFENDPK